MKNYDAYRAERLRELYAAKIRQEKLDKQARELAELREMILLAA